MTTGEKIKYYRKSLGLTQEDLGKSIGVGKAAINKYETGIVVNLKRSTLAALAKALHVNLSNLLDDSPTLDADQSTLVLLTDDESRLVFSYRSLSPRGKDLLNDRAEELKLLYGKKSEDSSAESV